MIGLLRGSPSLIRLALLCELEELLRRLGEKGQWRLEGEPGPLKKLCEMDSRILHSLEHDHVLGRFLVLGSSDEHASRSPLEPVFDRHTQEEMTNPDVELSASIDAAEADLNPAFGPQAVEPTGDHASPWTRDVQQDLDVDVLQPDP